MEDRFIRQMKFIMEIEKLKKITRQSYIYDGSRKENDAEHSYSLALMALVLSEYSNIEVDVLKVVKMVMIHDIVEIDAGDTYAYDEEGNKSKKERENNAAQRIFGILPQDQANDFKCIWEEFEAEETKESKFAAAIDKVHPILLNDITNGRAWKEHDVHKNQIMSRNINTEKGSEQLWEYCKNLIEKNILDGNIKA